MKLFGVVGWKNAGKTTLVERLVAEISARGLSVSTVKHAHHGFDVDHEATDSWRHRAAGAAQVLISSPRRWALMSELRGADEPSLERLLARLDPVDLVLIEGFKTSGHAKLEVFRSDRNDGAPRLAAQDANIRALVSDLAPEARADARKNDADPGLPHFHRDDIPRIADFVLSACELAP